MKKVASMKEKEREWYSSQIRVMREREEELRAELGKSEKALKASKRVATASRAKVAELSRGVEEREDMERELATLRQQVAESSPQGEYPLIVPLLGLDSIREL